MMMRSKGSSNLFVPYVSHWCLLLNGLFIYLFLFLLFLTLMHPRKKERKKKLTVVSSISKLNKWLKSKRRI